MAQNWTMKEATKEVLAGNKAAMVDIGRRFPLTLAAISATGNNAGALTIINALPDHITARKIEAALKDGVQETDEDADDADDADDVEEKPVKAAKAEKTEKKAPAKATKAKKEEVEDDEEDEADEIDYEEMSAMDLYKLCKTRKIAAEPKKKADVYVKLLKADDKKKAAKAAKPAKAEKEEADDEDWDI